MSEAATAPPPPPPPATAPPPLPVFTEESFKAFAEILEHLASVCDAVAGGCDIPIPESCDVAVRTVGKMFATLDQKLHAGGVNVHALHAWAARAATLSAVCTGVMVKALAMIADHAAASEASVLVGPDLQPAAPPRRPELPPHLMAVVRDQAGHLRAAALTPERVVDVGAVLGPLHTFSITPVPNGHRVVCHTCDRALGEVRDLETAETIAATHQRGGDPVARIETGEDADRAFGKGSELAAEVRDRIARTAAAGEQLVWIHPDAPPPLGTAFDVPTCRYCGCTQNNACSKLHDGKPVETCSWRELNPETNAGTCTACAE